MTAGRPTGDSVYVAVMNTILGFYRALDLRLDDVTEFFEAEGVWLRLGKPLHGRDAIKAALASRDPARTSCHLVSNLLVTPLSEGKAQCEYFLSVYEGTAESPLRMASILASHDRLVSSSAGWKIIHKQSRRHLPAEK